MKSKSTTIFLISFFILLAAGFAFWAYPKIKDSRKTKLAYMGEPGHAVHPFKFVNQDGDTITKDVMKGKIAVIEYFFATCKGICPTMNENLSKVYQTFRNNDDVVILSHTVDPERDSAAALKKYAEQFEADSKHWMFLTGSKRDLYDQAYYSYLVTAVDSTTKDTREEFIHTEHIVLVDKYGKLRIHMNDDGTSPMPYDGTDKKSMEQLIKDIHTLLEEQP